MTASRKRSFVKFGIIITIPLIAWGVAEFYYQMRIARLSTAVDKVWQVTAKPVSITDKPYFSYVQAPYLIDSFCVDNGPCPSVTKAWLVLVDPNTEPDMLQDIYRKSGLSTDISLSETGFWPLSDRAPRPPYQAPPGKEWKSFDISASEYPSGWRAPIAAQETAHPNTDPSHLDIKEFDIRFTLDNKTANDSYTIDQISADSIFIINSSMKYYDSSNQYCSAGLSTGIIGRLDRSKTPPPNDSRPVFANGASTIKIGDYYYTFNTIPDCSQDTIIGQERQEHARDFLNVLKTIQQD